MTIDYLKHFFEVYNIKRLYRKFWLSLAGLPMLPQHRARILKLGGWILKDVLQAKNRIKEIDALLVELQQEREDLEKYISEQPESMEDVELYDLLDSNDKNFVRTLNCMRQVGVNTLSEFIAKNFTRRDLMQIRNFGKKSIDWMLEELKVKAGVEYLRNNYYD